MKFNVFNQIHKGLRTLMFDTALKVQQTDFSNPQQASVTLDQVNLLLELFDAHANHENTCILNVATKIPAIALSEFEAEHDEDMALTEKLRSQIGVCKSASGFEAHQAGTELLFALNDFVAFNLAHMNKEESVLNELLWQHYTAEEIIGMERNIQAMIPPDKMAIYSYWMIKGLNDAELMHWLTIVKAEAPDFVFMGLTNACETHLPTERWEKLKTVA